MNKAKKNKQTLLIQTVGGSPEPLITSIDQIQPDRVYFIVSLDSYDREGKLLKGSYSQIPEICEKAVWKRYEHTLYEVSDAQNLDECWKAAEAAIRDSLQRAGRAEKQDGASSDEGEATIYVDFTGGTKLMSASLMLASIEYKVKYVYVGGSERDKGGLGTVQSGSEQVLYSPNPWERIAKLELKKIEHLLVQHEYAAALELANDLKTKEIEIREDIERLSKYIEFLKSWDNFDYKRADGQRKDILQTIRQKGEHAFQEPRIKGFAIGTEQLFPVLESLEVSRKRHAQKRDEIIEKSKGFPIEVSEEDRPDYRPFVLDTFSNAERRMAQGKPADAMLRLYRIVEMMAQDYLVKNHGIFTAKVFRAWLSKQGWEEQLADPIKASEEESADFAKLALEKSWQLIGLLEPECGLWTTWEKHGKEFKRIQSARNDSFLAHGFNAVQEDKYNKLKEFILTLGYFSRDELYQFPVFFDH